MKKINKKRRVVVTGLGVVSSIGIGWQDFWKNLIAGKSGISKISSMDTIGMDNHHAGEIKDFQFTDYIKDERVGKTNRTSQLALVGAKLALKDAGINLKDIKDEKMGVAVGTTMGEAQVLQKLDEQFVKDNIKAVKIELLPYYPSNIISTLLANYFKIKSSNMIFANACAAGNYSIGFGFDQIQKGKADMMVVGGVDAFSRINTAGFNRLFAVAPEKCQPFDKNRQGMMVGEGAGILILESYEHAQERKASIYAEVLGYGLSCDGIHMTQPNGIGIEKCMVKALKTCNLEPEDVDYISAHGTGTVMNDKTESKAIREVFYTNGKKTPVSSVKSMLGHTMGAASAIEAIVCCLSIKDNVIPPTINFEEKDPECDIDCVPNKARKLEIKTVMNNSFAFGGNNASVIFVIKNKFRSF